MTALDLLPDPDPLDDSADARVVVHSRSHVGAPRLDRVEHRVAPDDVPGLLRSLLTVGLGAKPGIDYRVMDVRVVK